MFAPEPAKEERCRVLYVSPLKALAVDVERNLRAPIAGIAAWRPRARRGAPRPFRRHPLGRHARSGAGPHRAHAARHPDHDAGVALPAADLAGARGPRVGRDGHRRRDPLARAEQARRAPLPLARAAGGAAASGSAPLQRIGLSATQRPLEEVARLLGGGEVAGTTAAPGRPRPVEIVDAGSRKVLDLRVEVPVEDMARLGRGARRDPVRAGRRRSGAALDLAVDLPAPGRADPRAPLDDDLRQQPAPRRAPRRRPERRSAGEEIALAHHGSVAREKRLEIEDRLKRGELPRDRRDLLPRARHRHGRRRPGRPDRGAALGRLRASSASAARATASVRRLAGDHLPEVPGRPPRGGRGHRADGRGQGRGDAPIRATRSTCSRSRSWRSSRSIPIACRRPLSPRARARRPSRSCPARSFEGVLDMLSGRYPSDEFAELRRASPGTGSAGRCAHARGRAGVAVVNAGTIPDRGLYGVFLAGGDARRQSPGRRARRGDGVRVAPGRRVPARRLVLADRRDHARPGPRDAGAGRAREDALLARRPARAAARVRRARSARCRASFRPRRVPRPSGVCRDAHGLDARAAPNLVAYLREQREATGEVPSDRTIVVERYLDEIGDWRVCVLSPFGARVHAPWAMAVLARLARGERRRGRGALVRRRHGLPAPGVRRAARHGALFLPASGRGRGPASCATLGETLALRGALPRERGARAAPARGGIRAAAARSGRSASAPPTCSPWPRGTASFPIILETYRECLRDVFDLPGPRRDPARRSPPAGSAIGHGRIRARPSPFAGVAPLLATSRTSSTTATRRSPSAGRRRCRSTRRSCGSSSARRSCASSSTRKRSRRSKPRSSGSRDGAHPPARGRRPRPAPLARRPDAGGDRRPLRVARAAVRAWLAALARSAA